MEVKELRDEIVPRLDRIDKRLALTNGRVSKLEMFRVVLVTVMAIGVFVVANAAAWIAVAQ